MPLQFIYSITHKFLMFSFKETVTEAWILAQLNGSLSHLDALSKVRGMSVVQDLFFDKLMRRCVSFPWLPSIDVTKNHKRFNMLGGHLDKNSNSDKKNRKKDVIDVCDPRQALGFTKEQVVADLMYDAAEVKKSLENPNYNSRCLELSLKQYLETMIY